MIADKHDVDPRPQQRLQEVQVPPGHVLDFVDVDGREPLGQAGHGQFIKRSAFNSPKGAMLPFLIIDNLRREARGLGIRTVEMSWILEDNMPMRRIIEAVGGERYKTYRLYAKSLA